MVVKPFAMHQDHSAKEKAVVPKSIKAIIDTTSSALMGLFNDTFVDPENLRNKIEGDADHVDYSLNMIRQVINNNSESFAEDFAKALQEHVFSNDNIVYYKDNVFVASGTGDVREENLSIMDEATLNELLLINEYASRSRKENENALNMIALRIAHVLPASLATLDNNPIDPKNFLMAFSECCSHLNFDLDEKRHLFRVFDEGVLHQLATTYEKVNDVFISHGVLPHMKRPETMVLDKDFGEHGANAAAQPAAHPTNHSQQSYSGTPAESPAYSWQNTEGMEQAHQPAPQPDLFNAPVVGQTQTSIPMSSYGNRPTDLLSELLNQYHAETSPQLRDSTKPVKIPFQEVIDSELPKINNAFKSSNLSKRDKRVVNILNNLFDNIFDDKSLTEPTKKQMARLQVPVLNLGLNDQSFFSDREHPARQLLNNIAKAGEDWFEDKDINPKIKKSITDVVDNVVKNFGKDQDVLEKSNQELDSLLENLDKNCQLICQRMVQVEKAQEAVGKANNKIDAAINDVFSKRYIPELVEDLSNEVWKKNMMLAYFKYGSDHDLWNNLVKSLEFFVRGVQPDTKNSRQILTRKSEKIKKDIQKLLKNIHAPKEKQDNFLTKVDELFSDLVKAKEKNQPVDYLVKQNARKMEVAEAGATPNNEHQTASVSEAANNTQTASITENTNSESNTTQKTLTDTDNVAQKFANTNTLEKPSGTTTSNPEKAKSGANPPIPVPISSAAKNFLEKIKFDTWVEYQDNGITKRCKYVCQTGEKKQYIFVNRYGMKVMDTSKEELAEKFDQGQIKILANSDIFDSALEKTIEHMRQMARVKQLNA